MSERKRRRRRLRVAQLVDCFLSISEVFIYELIRSLQSVENFVVTRQIRNRELFPFEPLYLLDGHGRKRIKSILGRIGLGSDCDLAGAESIIGAEGADLVHAHFGLLGARAVVLKRRLGIPLITSFYGVDASKQAKEPGNQKLFRMLFEEGDLFLAEGTAMKCRLIDLGCPHDMIAIQHLGVDVEQFAYIERPLHGSGGNFRLLFCGRFVEKKGLLDALAAVKLVRGEGMDLEFRVVGDGPMREEAEGFVEDNFLSPYVHFLGMIDHNAYKKELYGAQLLIAPSRVAEDGDTEGGAPTVLLEAQASGLPVLSTTHADIPEYVVNGEGGILVGEGDVKALATALTSLIRRPQELRKMGKLGRLHVVENYNIRHEACKLERKYEEVSS